MNKLFIVLENEKPLWLTEYPDDFEDETVRPATRNDLTAPLVADFLDQACENCNRHDFVGAHAALAKLLIMRAGKTCANVMMRAILKAGGLHKMAEGVEPEAL